MLSTVILLGIGSPAGGNIGHQLGHPWLFKKHTKNRTRGYLCRICSKRVDFKGMNMALRIHPGQIPHCFFYLFLKANLLPLLPIHTFSRAFWSDIKCHSLIDCCGNGLFQHGKNNTTIRTDKAVRIQSFVERFGSTRMITSPGIFPCLEVDDASRNHIILSIPFFKATNVIMLPEPPSQKIAAESSRQQM